MGRKTTLWVIVCVLAAQTTALADGVVLDGISPRALARGGTNIGHFDNGGILHDNPAAMVNMESDGLMDVGVITLLTDFGYSDPANNVSDTTFTPLPEAAYIRKSADGVWAYGVGVFTPAGFTETYDMQGPAPFGGQRHYKSFGALMKVLPGVSCRVTERLSVGGTFGVGVCHAELEGPYTLQGPGPLTGIPTLLDTQATGATPVWSFALQYILTESTTVGVTYLSESSFDLHGNTLVTVPGLGSTRYDSTLDVTWPQSVGIGVRQELGACRTVSADVIWYDWSGAFDEFVLRLRDPANAAFPETDDHYPLSWRDTVSVRLGYEQRLASGGTLRFGYVHHRNPIPNSTLTPFIQATLEDSFSVGYGWCWCGWEIDLGYMFLFGNDVEVGTSQFVGGDFDNSRHESQVHSIFLGFTRKF